MIKYFKSFIKNGFELLAVQYTVIQFQFYKKNIYVKNVWDKNLKIISVYYQK